MDFFIKALTSLLIIMGPFSVMPVFLSITENNTSAEKNLIARKAVFTSLGLSLFFAFFGSYFFKIFGFSIQSFRVAGGILLLLMSISMLHATRSKIRITDEEHQEGIDRTDVSVFPLAIPLIVGPGTISTIILLIGELQTFYHWIGLTLAILLSNLMIYFSLRLSGKAILVLKATGLNIMTRVMGLILAAISVEYIFTGIKNYFNL